MRGATLPLRGYWPCWLIALATLLYASTHLSVAGIMIFTCLSMYASMAHYFFSNVRTYFTVVKQN